MLMAGLENDVFRWNKGPLREVVGHKVGEQQEQPRKKSKYQPWNLRISFPPIGNGELPKLCENSVVR